MWIGNCNYVITSYLLKINLFEGCLVILKLPCLENIDYIGVVFH